MISLAGCSPYFFALEYVCFEEGDNVHIISRSKETDSQDPQDVTVHFPVFGLPTELLVEYEKYIVRIFTPTNIRPVVFITLSGIDGERLTLKEPHLIDIEADYHDYQYSFLAEKAEGLSLKLSIYDGE